MTNDEKLVGLIDRRRELAAQVAGLDAEIALAVGDRDGARRAAEEMKAQMRTAIAEVTGLPREGD